MGVRIAQAALYALLGLSIGAAVTLLAIGMSGGGHGWNSAILSVFSLAGAPLTGIACAFRGTRFGRVLIVMCLCGAIALDGLLLTATLDEGTEYVAKAWNAAAGWVLAWATLFASWQLIALVAAVFAVQGAEAWPATCRWNR